MTVSGISGQTFYEKVHKGKGTHTQSETQAGTAFSDNLRESDIYSDESENHSVEDAAHISTASHSLRTSMILQESGRVQFHAVAECSARHITYAQSDHVKVHVTEGYTFKAQVQAERHKVYIEKKTDSGEVTGYEVDPLKLNKNTEDPLEQMALEAWELARRAFMGEDTPFHEIDPEREVKQMLVEAVEEPPEKSYSELTIPEAMQRFYDFVEDCIKNGPPKYQTGGSEMSVKEWNRLLAKIDDEINAAKEQLREELKKAKEKAKITGDNSPEEAEVLGITKEQIARLFEDPDKEPAAFAVPVDPEEIYQAWMAQDKKNREV